MFASSDTRLQHGAPKEEEKQCSNVLVVRRTEGSGLLFAQQPPWPVIL